MGTTANIGPVLVRPLRPLRRHRRGCGGRSCQGLELRRAVLPRPRRGGGTAAPALAAAADARGRAAAPAPASKVTADPNEDVDDSTNIVVTRYYCVRGPAPSTEDVFEGIDPEGRHVLFTVEASAVGELYWAIERGERPVVQVPSSAILTRKGSLLLIDNGVVRVECVVFKFLPANFVRSSRIVVKCDERFRIVVPFAYDEGDPEERAVKDVWRELQQLYGLSGQVVAVRREADGSIHAFVP